MTVKRDYGVFSKAAARQLKPLIEHLGYRQLKGASFGREREGWIEGFFLHQTSWGGGYFWVEIGIDVPKMGEYWQNDASADVFSILIGARLDKQGINQGAESYEAENAIELGASLQRVAMDLEAADSWFAQFRSITDVVEEYGRRGAAGAIGNINYGFLLLVAGKISEGKERLEMAREQWQKIVIEEDPHKQRKRPGKESLKFHNLNVQRLNVIEAALRELP